MVSLGTMVLYDNTRVDFPRMRRERREKVVAAMREHDIDALILGREPNAQYVAGVRRLHLNGTRPWGPGLVVIRDRDEMHAMSVWDDGMPPEIPNEQLFGIGWNPMNLIASVQKIEGISTAKRIGVDYSSPLFQQLLPMAAPDAQLVNAESLLREVRLHKTPDEIACIRIAVAIAEGSLQASIDALHPGTNGRLLLGEFEGHMCDYGISTPASEGTFRRIDPATGDEPATFPRLTTDERIDEGDLVALSGGVLWSGYEGSVGRTWRCGDVGVPSAAQRALHRRWRDLFDRVLEACRPGATGADLRAAYEASGEPITVMPIASSIGIGSEGPIAGSALGAEFDATQRIASDMVLTVQAHVGDEHGGYFGLETVLVTDDGPEVLTTLSHGPLAESDDRE
jgi:Xaa-Pro aminopeptidase